MALTINYLYPVVGTIPPTAAQAALVNTIVASIVFDTDAETLATITHNWAFATNGAAPNTGQNFPEVILVPSALNTGLPFLAVSGWSTNTVAVTKTSLAGGSCTVTAYLHRPHSIVL